MHIMAGYRRSLSVALIVFAAAATMEPAVHAAGEPSAITFEAVDGGEIHALLSGEGEHAVVLAHGMVFDKESWGPLAPRLTAAGLRVLALDFRGYGDSKPGTSGMALYPDVLGAIAYLKEQGASRVSVVGASMGGGASARAAVRAGEGEIDRLVLLAPVAIPKPEEMHAARVVYISSEGDPALDRTKLLYERAPEPKSLEIIPGDAHAQHLFETEHAEALIEAILEALLSEFGDSGFDLSVPD